MSFEPRSEAGRGFAVVDPVDGRNSAAISLEVASWLASRGLSVLVAHLCTASSGGGIRSLGEISNHILHLSSEAFKGLLSNRGIPNLGSIVLDVKPDDFTLALIARSYGLTIFACSKRMPFPIHFLPALVVVESLNGGVVRRAGSFIEEMFSSQTAPRPAAFSIAGGGESLGSRIAARWRLPYWSTDGGVGGIVERILERAVPLGAEPAKIGEVSSKRRNASFRCEGGSVTSDAEDRATSELLSLLRKERVLKEQSAENSSKSCQAFIRDEVSKAARRLLSSMDAGLLVGVNAASVVKRVVDEAAGLGLLEPILCDARVTEIMVNGTEGIYVERNGVIERHPRRFSDTGHLMALIERMVAGAGRRVDESSPMVDARLPDGSRLNVVIPPLAIDGPAVTIRRFSKRMRGIEDALRVGMLTSKAAAFLAECVSARVSIVVSGGTGAGKTTLLGILAGAIGKDERIITIEDAAELCLDAPHVVRLEARPPGIEGTGGVSIRELVRNALRMRPDRIVVGEARGAEALDMLQAMNTGHEGSLATVHANSPRDAISRLETMVLMAGADLPIHVVREQIVRAVRLIVQVARLKDGRRRVIEIAEITGMEGSIPCMQTLAADSGDGELISTGIVPRLVEVMRMKGVEVCLP